MNQYGFWRGVWGLKNGFGVYEWADDRKYEDEWQNNKMHDRGYFEWPDGRKYKGKWKNLKAAWIFHYGHVEF